MPSPHPLGDYLRARRELLQPADVALPEGAGIRRVPGLRRSEVAAIAGISTEYYVKLEQGQEAHPTDQVLNSLSRALQLDATANSYLHALAHLPQKPIRPTSTPAVERTRWLIDSWPMTAAMILDRHFDIVATNPLMTALIAGYRTGRNSVAVLLLDADVRELHLDWNGLSMRSIALLRSRAGMYPDDARTQELIKQLMRESERFRELWHRYDIAGMTEGTHPIMHPAVGALSLQYAHLPLVGADDHSIFLYFAEPGTPTESALAALAIGR
ncbi:helix-turn-helix domain-containing protein [Subtercola frigoramans]|uniref:Transcriptional regulator with XRE-family HTH domain n=1 Tax=Subtercola frigoramans TaxID=120298 RepID=A0ABS2L3V4_9MICO|nr:helix-turn-helix transcriptional regulator [Subtercola frigoramans]MBM7471780.1 transcriptional regulator with XRE-family HTH domain [Subtercola frigoramans]